MTAEPRHAAAGVRATRRSKRDRILEATVLTRPGERPARDISIASPRNHVGVRLSLAVGLRVRLSGDVYRSATASAAKQFRPWGCTGRARVRLRDEAAR